MCFVYMGFEIINNVQDMSVYAVVSDVGDFLKIVINMIIIYF